LRRLHAVGERFGSGRSTRPIGREESPHRDADDVAYTLRRRWLTEIEHYRLEQSRLTGIYELCSRDLAIVDSKHPSLYLVLEIARQQCDSVGRTGFVKGLADFGHPFGNRDHRPCRRGLFWAAEKSDEVDADACEGSLDVPILRVKLERPLSMLGAFLTANGLEKLLLILEVDIKRPLRDARRTGDMFMLAASKP
jgi:hypothetical protein